MADRVIAVSATGLDELIAGLRGAGQSLGREQRRANKDVATEAQRWAQSAARSGTRQQAAMAGAIQARATQTIARLALSRAQRWGAANPAFWGQRRRFGWYGGWYAGELNRRRAAGFAGGRPQGLPWVGNSWTPGRSGEGPHVLNDTIADHLDEIGDLYLDAHMRALKAAFPGGPE
jgi:hypothetical protein